MLLCSWAEICRLLVITPLEALASALSWFVFSILLCLKLEGAVEITWVKTFIPLFANLAFSLYLNIIIFIRRLRAGVERPWPVAFRKHIANIIALILIFMTEVFIVQKLDGTNVMRAGYEMVIPLFCWFAFLLVFYCVGCSRQCQ